MSLLTLFAPRAGVATPPHPLAFLFASRDGFLYDGVFSSGGIDFATDATGETECETGGDVCLFVRDHSGRNHHLVQETSGNGLIYRVDGSGRKSFVTGTLTDGGAPRFAQVTGVGALPSEYLDIVVFRHFSYFSLVDAYYESTSMSGEGGWGGGATDRSALYGFNIRGGPFTYGAWRQQYNDAAGNIDFNGGGGKIFPYDNACGIFALRLTTDARTGLACELPATIPDVASNSWSIGALTVTNGGATTYLGIDYPANFVNLERLFRMRVYGTVTTEELATITAYLNDSGITAWEGGAG